MSSKAAEEHFELRIFINRRPVDVRARGPNSLGHMWMAEAMLKHVHTGVFSRTCVMWIRDISSRDCDSDKEFGISGEHHSVSSFVWFR